MRRFFHGSSLTSFTVPKTKRSLWGELIEVTRLQSETGWRYHRISDEVNLMQSILSMRGMDLRWQLSIESLLSDAHSA